MDETQQQREGVMKEKSRRRERLIVLLASGTTCPSPSGGNCVGADVSPSIRQGQADCRRGGGGGRKQAGERGTGVKAGEYRSSRSLLRSMLADHEVLEEEGRNEEKRRDTHGNFTPPLLFSP
ncbi:hypothetical protein E2C01_046108 [Portunus trituberculatus]|uniref:Uncharacterized protein n=1 Tax=Portunus trituberculatus TaxID=210409 RepID=A0A5B7G474_PORTR|nr:hypothetical protein [Portunus trituberculatus]